MTNSCAKTGYLAGRFVPPVVESPVGETASIKFNFRLRDIDFFEKVVTYGFCYISRFPFIFRELHHVTTHVTTKPLSFAKCVCDVFLTRPITRRFYVPFREFRPSLPNPCS
jgi:hypothetical protein